jgi:hypothetical protein
MFAMPLEQRHASPSPSAVPLNFVTDGEAAFDSMSVCQQIRIGESTCCQLAVKQDPSLWDPSLSILAQDAITQEQASLMLGIKKPLCCFFVDFSILDICVGRFAILTEEFNVSLLVARSACHLGTPRLTSARVRASAVLPASPLTPKATPL